MRIDRLFFFLLAIPGLLWPGTAFSENSGKARFQKNSKNITSPLTATAPLPDLVVEALQWSAPPKAGDSVGTTAILNIVMANKGDAPAGESFVDIRCQALSGISPPASMTGLLTLPPLGAGQSTTLAWPSASTEKWKAGSFHVTVTANAKNRIKESNSSNNENFMKFAVPLPAGPEISTLPQLEKQITADHLPLKEKTPSAKNQFAVQADIANPPASAGQIIVPEYTIHKVWSVPENPHTEEFLKILIKIENKTAVAADLPVYFKCRPMDGSACPGGQPGQEVVEFKKPRLTAGETREISTFHHGNDRFEKGRYLLAAAKDQNFSQGLVFTVMHVEAPEEVKVRINKLIIEKTALSPNDPIRITARPTETWFQIFGGGFIPQSQVFYQNTSTGGNIWTMDATQIQPTQINGKLPVTVSNVPGNYKIWVKNPDDSETEKFQLHVVAPGQPPQIYSWDPKVITEWMHWLDYSPSGRWAAYVLFEGENLSATLTDHWVESNSVSDHMVIKVNSQGDDYYKLLLWTPTAYPPQDGEIKLWIYNKHPDPSIDTRGNAQWFKIRVQNIPKVIPAPQIQSPAHGQKIIMENVVMDIIDPPGVRVAKYALEWGQKKGKFWVPVTMAAEISKSMEDTHGTRIIPLDQFENNGHYRFRAQVSYSNQQAVKLAPEWTPWREFEVVRQLTIPKQGQKVMELPD